MIAVVCRTQPRCKDTRIVKKYHSMILRNDSAQKTILPFPVALRAKSVATISLRGAESLLGRIVREAIEPSRVDRQKLTTRFVT